MGIQKYRADIRGDVCPNGAVPHYAKWIGGPSLAKIANCPTNDARINARNVFVTGVADTFFSIPAACSFKGKRVKGFLTCEDGNWLFNLEDESRAKLDVIGEVTK